MKKIFTVFVLLCTTLVISAQEVVPTSFPRKFLVEQYTGDWCPNCTYGIYSIEQYVSQSPTACIWISHHLNDNLQTNQAVELFGKYGDGGVPAMALNRTKITGTATTFHPAYLAEDAMMDLIYSKSDTLAEASVMINHTYDANSRELNVTVSGQVAKPETTQYLLNVLIKENGHIGKQSDNSNISYGSAGFKEFIHPCVVRKFITNGSWGDTVKVQDQAYSKTLTYTIDQEWVPENCCIVAYITPVAKKPTIINAEETPLVAGTTGGAHYHWPYGITENKEPANATKLQFTSAELTKPSEDKLQLQLIADKTTRSSFYGAMKLVVTLEFNTTGNTIPTDTLDFAEGNQPNTFSIGTVDVNTQEFGGSNMKYYTVTSINTGNWDQCHAWRINSGRFLINETGGFYASGKLYNGKSFTITYTGSLPQVESATNHIVFDQAHVEKLMREGQFIICIDGVEYDIQGRVINQ